MGPDAFDVNIARGAVLVLLIIAFLGIWAWAWSKNRTSAFRAMSMLPLEEDDGAVPDGTGGNDNETQKRTGRTKE